MEWLELATKVEREAVESVNELFSGYAYGGGTVIEEPIVPEPGGDGYAIDSALPVIVRAYIPSDELAPAIQARLAEALWHLGQLRRVEPLSVRALAEEDWANAWKAYYQVHRIGRRVVIKPAWQDYQPRTSDLVVELDPGMAFGTGLHPTTQLCIRAMEACLQRGSRVLDVGTGSGILSIAAAKLGAVAVTAVDVDDVAVRAARGNVALNGLQDVVAVAHRTVGEQDAISFDLVVANITARAIAGLTTSLADAVRPGGLLLLCGIIADQAGTVRTALRKAGLRVAARRQAGDWLAYLVRKQIGEP